MAKSEENDLIGYDPLAWMSAEADINEEISNGGNRDSGSAQDGGDINLSDTENYSDDSEEDAERNLILNATIEDELVIEDVEDESASVSINADEDFMDVATQDAIVEDPVTLDVDSSQLDLDTTLTIQNVVKLHEKLKDIVAMHDQIEINASDVSSIDTATLQLLVSLKKDAVKLNKQVSIIYPSPRFVESAKLLGLLDALDVQDQ